MIKEKIIRSSSSTSISSSSTSASSVPTSSAVNAVNIPKASTAASELHLKSIDFGTIRENPDYENLINTSAVLHYCKCKILRPYMRLFTVMGLKSCSSNSDTENGFSRYCILANIHTFQVIIFICMGFFLQYMACFRRDRGFCCPHHDHYQSINAIAPVILNHNNDDSTPDHDIKKHQIYNKFYSGGNSAVFSYLVPSVLYLIAYLYTVYLFRIKENEQLSNLMERTFLLSSSNNTNSNRKHEQTKLVKILWFFIGSSIIWMTLALITVNVMMMRHKNIQFRWLINEHNQALSILKIFLIICTCWHDMVQSTIITSYCLQGQLLIAHLYFLKIKLLEHSLPVTDWMKDILEFKKLLKYFNDDLGPSVCIYTIVNLSWAISGIIWLLYYDKTDSVLYDSDVYDIDNSSTASESHVNCINIVNVILWILISLCPFIQAARLTTACSTIQTIGHDVRVRPFVYQGTPGEDLDTILLYTSTLKMCAKLFRVPVTGRYLVAILTIGSIVVITLGQCHFFS